MKVKHGCMFIVILTCCLTIFSCRLIENKDEFTVEKQIGNSIKANCQKKSKCIIRISKVTPFSWDKLYVFDHSVESYKIDEIVGIDVETSDNMKRKFIFVKNGQIVYVEENESELDSAVDGEIVFRDEGPKDYAIFENSAEFQVTPKDNTYDFKCLNCKK